MKRFFLSATALALGLTLVGTAGPGALAQQAASGGASATQTPALYVIQYRPGPTWRTGKPLGEQGLERHGAYMRSLAARGDLLAAGPLTTIEGGLVVLRVEDIDAAVAIMEADPAVQDGQFIGEVSVWRPAIDPAGRFAEVGGG